MGQVQGPSQVESGAEAVFSISASSGPGTISYSWKVNGYTVQSGASPQLTYTNGGSAFVVSVTVADGANSYSRTKSVSIGTCGGFSC